MKQIFGFFSFFFLMGLATLSAQLRQDNIFRNVILKVDTLEYSMQKNSIVVGNEKKIYFEYANSDEVCEVTLFAVNDSNSHKPVLLSSGDFSLIDSIYKIDTDQFRFKVRFSDLTNSEFLTFRFASREYPDSSVIHEVKLFPFTKTNVYFFPTGDELFIGEEKVFELVADNIGNVKPIANWQSNNDIDYRVSSRFDQLRLHIIPKALGQKTLQFQLETFKQD